jgi:predicted chitinase
MPTPADYLRAAMDAQQVTDNAERAGLAAIAMGESQMMGYVELGYGHTSNERIREVFGSRVPADDSKLDALKADDEAFFEWVYGCQTRTGQELGNITEGDGYKFRGRYAIQITGRGNYTRYAAKSGHPEILANPDLGITDPAIGMALCVAYILDRYRGGGFEAMLDCVGNNTPDIAATKERYFAQFAASGEFNVGASSPVSGVVSTPAAASNVPPAPRPTTPSDAADDGSEAEAEDLNAQELQGL